MAGQDKAKSGGGGKIGRNLKKHGSFAGPRTKHKSRSLNMTGKQRALGCVALPHLKYFDSAFGREDTACGDINPHSHACHFQAIEKLDHSVAKELLSGLTPWARRSLSTPKKKGK